MNTANEFMLDKKIAMYRELLKLEHQYTDEQIDTIVNAFPNKQLALAHLRSSLNTLVGAFGPPNAFDRPKDAVEAPPLQHVNETYDPPCLATTLKNWFKGLF